MISFYRSNSYQQWLMAVSVLNPTLAPTRLLTRPPTLAHTTQQQPPKNPTPAPTRLPTAICFGSFKCGSTARVMIRTLLSTVKIIASQCNEKYIDFERILPEDL
mmetsp:Transcript_10118/g.15476  ORF Transcript_10118/g.15476 Transcript_10118/m.15476 type:complete len:104 (-) Transcript_10118:462-773(-)